jgi:glycosyltransferase involved in cell wall biosynthesis
VVLLLFLPWLLLAHEPTICVTIPIQNDEDTLEKCLTSIAPIADCISIIDTGSTDRSLEIVKNFLLESNIPGKIFKQSLGESRDRQAILHRIGQKMVNEMQFSLQDTYLLFLEPSMRLNIPLDFDKSVLIDDAYLFLEKTHFFSRYQLHLLRAATSWSAKLRPEHIQTKLPTIELEWLKAKKTASTLLERGLSHRFRNHYDEAIQCYQEHLETLSFPEEFWFCKYLIGESYEGKGEWEQALNWYLNAYQSDPSRAEPIQKISTHYRASGDNNLAFLFAHQGIGIPYSDDHIYFSSPPLSHYHFEEELSIAAYYTAHRDAGFKAASDLVLKKGVPWQVRDQTYRNLLYYVHPLKNARYLPIEIDLPLVRVGSEERYHPQNPSICKAPDGGYYVVCRSVNFTQTGAKYFHTNDALGVFRTRNFLVHYDRNFQVLSSPEIVENLVREQYPSCVIEGMEDCRIFSWNDSLWFTCSTFDTNPTGTIQVSLCKLGETPSKENQLQVELLTPLLGPDPYRCEKNWLPFVEDGVLRMLYTSDPLIIYEPDPVTGVLEKVVEQTPPLNLAAFRGSAGPIPFDGGYLMLIHEVVFLLDHTRNYLHRFVALDKAFRVKSFSRPFTFFHNGVEFCCGMIGEEDQLILTVGVEDAAAYLCFIDFPTVRSLLEPVR